MPFVTSSDGTRLHYATWGVGQPVVFAHAWGLNGDMWNYQIADLVAAGCRGVTYDRRGHGRSDRAPGSYDLDTLADDLAALIEALNMPPLILVGHSMGAQEAVRYVSRHGSGRIAGLVLSAPPMPTVMRSSDNPDGLDPALLDDSAALLRRDVGLWLDASSAGYWGVNTDVSAALADWTRRQILDVPVHVLSETLHAWTHEDFEAALANIPVPALVIHGAVDASVPLRLGQRTAELVPDSSIAVIEDAGHGVYLSHTQRYNHELMSFIAQTTRAVVG
jgi:non-heme chloroperoxidase